MKNENCPNCNRLLDERSIDWINKKCPFCDKLSITDNIKDIYLYDDEYIMIIEIPHQRKVDYRLVEKEVYHNLKNSDLDFFNSDLLELLETEPEFNIISVLDSKSWDLAQRLRDLNNYYVVSNDCFDESSYLEEIIDVNNDNVSYVHKKYEIITLLTRLGGKE